MRKKNKKQDVRFHSTEIKKQQYLNDDYKTMLGLLITLIVVGICVALLFFLNGKFVTKDHFQEKEEETTSEVEYDETIITVSDLFKIDKKEYMVLLYDEKDKTSSFLYSGLISGFEEDKTPLYSIELGNAMNRKYFDSKGKENRKPTKVDEVLVTRPTLIVMKNGKVVEYITDTNKIVEKLAKK